MRVLIITNLFPSSKSPQVASFNRQQFAALGKLCDVEVLATTPWFPGKRFLARFAEHKTADNLPAYEEIDGLAVYHPRTLLLPRIGAPVAAPLFAASLLPLVPRYRGKVDVVLGSWAHPDGCAAILIASLLGVPACVKLHGTDMNVVARMPGPRRVMRALLPRAAAIVTVSSALGREAQNLGVPEDRIHLVMNGVDSELFHLRDRAAARRELGLPEEGRVCVCIGNVIETKGVHDLVTAFDSIGRPDIRLYFVGDGNARAELEAQRLPGVHFVGSQPFQKIPVWLAASDLLILPSWNEGTPNVILEALACGRRVVSTDVGGVPDLLFDARLGAMVPHKNPPALAQAISREVDESYAPEEIARLGARGGWLQSAEKLRDVLQSTLQQ